MTTDTCATSARLLESIACIARLMQGELRERAAALGLQWVHLQALAYLARANRYSNTAVALTDFLGTSKGTVSQSLLLLHDKGLIERQTDATDRRVIRLALTAKGSQALKALEVAQQWDQAVGSLPPDHSAAAAQTLTEAVRALQQRTGHLSFGVCRGCSHFRVEAAEAFRCGLTGEALTARDSQLICREHRVGAPVPLAKASVRVRRAPRHSA